MELKECLSDMGNFSINKYFLYKYSCISNLLKVTLEDKDLDLEKLNEQKLKELLPDYELLRGVSYVSIGEPEEDYDDEADDGLFYVDEDGKLTPFGETKSKSFILEKENVIIDIDRNQIDCLYAGYTEEEMQKEVKRIVDLLPGEETGPKTSEVYLLGCEQGSYFKMKRDLPPLDFEVDINADYNDDFAEVYEDTLDFLKSKDSGLIVYRGMMGTGKTTVINHIIANHPAQYVIITSTIAAHLADPELVSFVLSLKDAVLILEDCEAVLKDREQSYLGGALANLLNMTDGILSRIFNLKMICTFNADIESIDKAVLRPGRCYANYEFKPLCKEKALKLIESQNLSYDSKDVPAEGISLADLYCKKVATGKPKKQQKKIGF